MYNLLSNISLSSWDEAWYGVIAKNIFKTGDIFNLVYNGNPFYDHPPFVFWLQALAMKFFGVNEFSVRLPSLLLGFATLIVVYLVAKEIFGKLSGIFSAAALLTSPWFLTRMISGNLDVPLTFLFALTFYLAIKASKNIKYLYPTAISLGLLFLTKSLVPFTIIPTVIYLLWGKLDKKEFTRFISLFLLTTVPWFLINLLSNADLISRYLSIGYPGASAESDIFENILLTKIYLHNGIGSWFWWCVLSMGLGFIFYRRKFLPILIFVATFLLPFAFSNKGHIWHLIPLHPFLLLSFFGIIELTNKRGKFYIMAIIFLVISWSQIKRNWYEIIKAPSYTSDIEILSAISKDYKELLYLDDDAVPEAVFYSDKDRVERISRKGEIADLFNTNKEFLLLTKKWRLDEEGVNTKSYEIIEIDRDKMLIRKI